MSEDQVHRFRYYIEPGSFTKEELKGTNFGACDALILHSIMFGEDGSREEQVLTIDGRTMNNLDDLELFKSWVGMAKDLSESSTLQSSYKDLARRVFEDIREKILESKAS